MFNSEIFQKKWNAVLEHKDAPKIKDAYRRAVTAVLLEQQEKAMKEERAQYAMLNEAGTQAGSVQNFDPILISLVRRAMPNLIAYDVAGVQPMSGPTGLIFALKPKYNSSTTSVFGSEPSVAGTTAAPQNSDDALYGGKLAGIRSTTATNTSTSGATSLTISANTNITVGMQVTGTGIAANTYVTTVTSSTAIVISKATTANITGGTLTFANTANISSAFSGGAGGGYTTAQGEALSGSQAGGAGGADGTSAFRTMGFSIEKTVVTANTRALKADYTMELAQDLKAIHGLDAESELANILSSEILFEINREVIETINAKAVTGAQFGYTTAGTFDVANDADGRWAVERYKSLLVAIELEANTIAKDTRRGKGNFIITSSNVASVLAASGVLDYAPALSTDLQVDDTGNTFAGVLNGRIKVYVDPYALTDYITVGYRGSNPYDAGLFYAPYVPLTMVRAVDTATFQPKIAFKTRYGLVANPFVAQINPGSASSQTGANGQNFYYRNFAVANLSLKGSTLTHSV